MAAKFDWEAARWAGIFAGVIFMLLDMFLVATAGGEGLWGPPRMIAAMALGKDVLSPSANFEIGMMIVAMVIHFALSIFYAIVLGWLISSRRLSWGYSLVGGIVFGLLIYLVDSYLPWRYGRGLHPDLGFDFRSRDVWARARLDLPGDRGKALANQHLYLIRSWKQADAVRLQSQWRGA